MMRLTVTGLNKSRSGRPVLRDLSFELEPSSFCVIVGASGCGKSTLLRLLAGLEQPDAGTIAFDGVNVGALPPAARDAGFVFQDYALYPHMSVRQNLSYGLRVRGCPRHEIERKVAEIADMLKLGELLDRRPHQLSGGQQQRVAIGRAVIRQPRLLMLDEPLSNLDARLRAEMRVEIRALQARTGATTLFVTHDQSEALTMADHLMVMEEGRIVQSGLPQSLYETPACVSVGSFLGEPEMNFLEVRCDDEGKITAADGTSLDLCAPGAPPRAILGIRAECILPVPAGLAAEVVTVENFGHRRVAQAVVAGTRIALVLSAGQTVHIGERLAVEFAAERCLLFATASKLKLPTIVFRSAGVWSSESHS